MYRVVLVDDDQFFLNANREALAADGDFDVIGMYYHGQEALPEILRLQPDLVITDIQMPFMNGPELVAALQQANFTGCVVANTTMDAGDNVLLLRGFGARAVFQKGLEPQALVFALKALLLDDSLTMFSTNLHDGMMRMHTRNIQQGKAPDSGASGWLKRLRL